MLGGEAAVAVGGLFEGGVACFCGGGDARSVEFGRGVCGEVVVGAGLAALGWAVGFVFFWLGSW